ncbi:hypothetical protein D3C77_412540 [compost metagenome]
MFNCPNQKFPYNLVSTTILKLACVIVASGMLPLLFSCKLKSSSTVAFSGSNFSKKAKNFADEKEYSLDNRSIALAVSTFSLL